MELNALDRARQLYAAAIGYKMQKAESDRAKAHNTGRERRPRSDTPETQKAPKGTRRNQQTALPEPPQGQEGPGDHRKSTQ